MRSLKLPITEVKSAIFGHPEFAAFQQIGDASSSTTGARSPRTQLTAFDKDGHPKALIETIAEELLDAFASAAARRIRLYQHLMDYWAETMQDDAYLIAADGWVAKHGAHRRDRQEGQAQGQGLGLRPDSQAD